MTAPLLALIATVVTPPRVPDSGMTGVMLGLGILSLGIAARFFKNRKR